MRREAEERAVAVRPVHREDADAVEEGRVVHRQVRPADLVQRARRCVGTGSNLCLF